MLPGIIDFSLLDHGLFIVNNRNYYHLDKKKTTNKTKRVGDEYFVGLTKILEGNER